MGWETRQRGGRYYVQKVREGGKVTSRYLGTGELAEAIAQMERLTRTEAEQSREERQQEQQALRNWETEVLTFYNEVEAVLCQTLEEAGYHRHHRGEWRKHRVQSKG